MSQLEKGDDLTLLVDQTTRQLRRNTLVAGSAWVKLATVGFLLAAVSLDMLLPLSVPLRVTVHVAFWIVLVGAVALAVVGPALRIPTPLQMALRIERALGGMHNRLVTLLDLRGRNGSAKTHPAMLERLVAQTRKRMAGYEVKSVADPKRMRRSLEAAGLLLVAVVLMAVIFHERMPTALSRLIFPTADIPPVTWLKIAAPGDVDVLQGENHTLPGKVERGETMEMTLMLRAISAGKNAPWVKYPMRRGDDGNFGFEVESVSEDYEYKLAAGRTWTPTHKLRMVRRPVIEELSYSVILPDYMKIAEPRPVEKTATQITVPVGSTLRMTAKVAGEPVSGEVQVFSPKITESQRVTDEETVWFEDDLPADAVTQGRWQWTTNNVRSGVRAHTFNWDRKPYGFRTRLNPLHLPQDGVLFLYAWLDPQTPPQQLVVSVVSHDQTRSLVWGAPAANLEKERPGTTRHLGPLPPTLGQWVRLEVPVNQAFSPGNEGVKLHGMSFEVDSGRVILDRAGYLVRHTATVKQETLEQTVKLPMKQVEQNWTGDVVVHNSVHVAARFLNSLTHPSLPQKPMSVIATEDQPPTIMVDRPGKDLLLPEPLPLPMLVRAFDDWGVEAVGIEMGGSPEKLSEPQWIENYDDNPTQKMVITSMDTRQMQPGQVLFYRLAARDRKKQIGRSEVYRITLAAPQSAQTPETAKKADPLDNLFKQLEKIAQLAAKLADTAAKLLPDLPKKPDEQLTDEQLKQMAQQQAEKLSQEQREQLNAAQPKLDQLQKQLAELSKQLDESAKQSEQSPLSSPLESQALEQLADKAEEMAQELDKPESPEGQPQKETDAQNLERLAKAQQVAGENAKPLNDLKKQLDKVQAAREQMKQDPAGAQEKLEDVLGEMKAQQAAEQLKNFEETLGEQKEDLHELQGEAAQLKEETPEADAEKLNAIAQKQKQLEEKAAEAVAEANELTGQPDASTEAGAPEPDKGSEGEKPQPGQEPGSPMPPEKGQSPQNPPPEGKGEETQRQQLQKQQEQLAEQLAESGKDVKETQSASESLREQIEKLQSQMGEKSNSESSESGDKPVDKPGDSKEQSASKSSNDPAQELKDLLASEEAQRLLRLAEKAALAQMEGGDPKQAKQGQQKSSPSRAQVGEPGNKKKGSATQSNPNTSAVLILDGAELKADVKDRVTLYRLPPRLRDPLIQGMQEKGPEGYQPLIDAYYRQLSREVK